MIARSLLSLLILLLCHALSLAQEKTIVVIIDTFVGNTNQDSFSVIAAKNYIVDINGKLTPLDGSTLTIIPKRTHPQIIAPIKVLHERNIILPLDSKGGSFTIKNITKLDTFRIAKWTILKNNIPDSTVTTTSYYRMINDSFVRHPYKTKTETYYSTSKDSIIKKIDFSLNDTRYSIPIDTKEGGGEVANWCGYEPLRRRNKFLKYSNEHNTVKKRFRYTRFNVQRVHSTYVYTGELTL